MRFGFTIFGGVRRGRNTPLPGLAVPLTNYAILLLQSVSPDHPLRPFARPAFVADKRR